MNLPKWEGVSISQEQRDEWIKEAIAYIKRTGNGGPIVQRSGDSLIVVSYDKDTKSFSVADCVIRRQHLWIPEKETED